MVEPAYKVAQATGMADRVGCVVIGAGVVGLAVARAMALKGHEVVILETAGSFGSETSSRNSEVIHAGIYYPTGSLKAMTCVAGKHSLYEYCVERGIAHRRCGKLIVATVSSQLAKLEALVAQARANDVPDLVLLSEADAKGLEPSLQCVGAALSPSTGIIDSHGFMLALLGDAEDAGATIAYRARATRIEPRPDGLKRVTVCVENGETETLDAPLVVNAAGLEANALAQATDGMPEGLVPPLRLAKGHYFSLVGRSPFIRLIYPVPEDGGLGVHLTLDLGGQARFGPDVAWVDTIDYGVPPERAERFYGAIRHYWPGLADGALTPAYAGIRPKLVGPGEPAADFLILGPTQHGCPGLVHLLGIESPGLTAALALADLVAERLAQ